MKLCFLFLPSWRRKPSSPLTRYLIVLCLQYTTVHIVNKTLFQVPRNTYGQILCFSLPTSDVNSTVKTCKANQVQVNTCWSGFYLVVYISLSDVCFQCNMGSCSILIMNSSLKMYTHCFYLLLSCRSIHTSTSHIVS